jgi:hypothetical protein
VPGTGLFCRATDRITGHGPFVQLEDPFFLVKSLVVFFHMIAALFSLIYFRVSTGN